VPFKLVSIMPFHSASETSNVGRRFRRPRTIDQNFDARKFFHHGVQQIFQAGLSPTSVGTAMDRRPNATT